MRWKRERWKPRVSGAFTQAELPELISSIDVMYAMYSPLRGNVLQGASARQDV